MVRTNNYFEIFKVAINHQKRFIVSGLRVIRLEDMFCEQVRGQVCCPTVDNSISFFNQLFDFDHPLMTPLKATQALMEGLAEYWNDRVETYNIYHGKENYNVW